MSNGNPQDITNDFILYVSPTASTYFPISGNNSQDITSEYAIYVAPVGTTVYLPILSDNPQDITDATTWFIAPSAVTYFPPPSNNSQDLTDNLTVYVSGIKCDEEIAWGGNHTGNGSVWWFYLVPSQETTQNIHTAQNIIGTITYINGVVTIDFFDNVTLANDDESVKIQGYGLFSVPKDERPSPELFTTYRGTDLEGINIGSYFAIAVYLNVIICEK